MIEVLVGRTLEQSIMEVMEEKQIANLHAYQVLLFSFQIYVFLQLRKPSKTLCEISRNV